MTDDEIITFVKDFRKTTLIKDLRRHQMAVIRIRLGIHKFLTKVDLPELIEWINRLRNIIKKQNAY